LVVQFTSGNVDKNEQSFVLQGMHHEDFEAAILKAERDWEE